MEDVRDFDSVEFGVFGLTFFGGDSFDAGATDVVEAGVFGVTDVVAVVEAGVLGVADVVVEAGVLGVADVIVVELTMPRFEYRVDVGG